MDIQVITARIQEITGWRPLDKAHPDKHDFSVVVDDLDKRYIRVHARIGTFERYGKQGFGFTPASRRVMNIADLRRDLDIAEKVLDYLNSL